MKANYSILRYKKTFGMGKRRENKENVIFSNSYEKCRLNFFYNRILKMGKKEGKKGHFGAKTVLLLKKLSPVIKKVESYIKKVASGVIKKVASCY